MQVLAIDLPFLIVSYDFNGPSLPLPIDTRKYKFGLVSKEYALALNPKLSTNIDNFITSDVVSSNYEN
jgi:hypothetical protein